MKTSLMLFAALCLCSGISAQLIDEVSLEDEGLFGKNTFMVKYSPGLDVGLYNLKYDGEDGGNNNWIDFDYNLTYFFMQGLGAELKLGYGRVVYKDEEEKNINSNFSVGLAGVYGYNINEDLNIYGKLGFEVGNAVDKDDDGDFKESLFGWRIEFGLPVEVIDESGVLVTPVLGYRSRRFSYDEGNYFDGSFYAGAQLNIALGCLDYACDMSNDWDLTDDRYERGTNVIGGSFYTRFNSGKLEDTYENFLGENTYTENVNRFKFNLEAYRYFFDNIAAGTNIYLNTYTRKPEDTDNKTSSTSWRFVPMVMANAPADGPLNNLFGVIGVGFGQETIRYESGDNETTSKDNVLDACFGAGFNIFFNEYLAYTTKVLYEINQFTDSDSDIKSNRNGLNISFGLRHHF